MAAPDSAKYIDYEANVKLDTGFGKRTTTVTEMADLASWSDVTGAHRVPA